MLVFNCYFTFERIQENQKINRKTVKFKKIEVNYVRGFLIFFLNVLAVNSFLFICQFRKFNKEDFFGFGLFVRRR